MAKNKLQKVGKSVKKFYDTQAQLLGNHDIKDFVAGPGPFGVVNDARKLVRDVKLAKNAKKLGRTADYKEAKKDAINDIKRSYSRILNPVKGVINMGKSIKRIVKNHPTWYENYPLDDLVGLNFGYRNSVDNHLATMMGLSIPSTVPSATRATNASTACEIRLAPSAPIDSKVAFIQAMNILYAKIRSANSGSINYTVADLAAYVLNVRNIRLAITQLRRTLGLSYYVNPYDSDAPRLLTTLSAGADYDGTNYNGITFDVVAAHAADIQNNLTIWFNLVSTLLPISLQLFDRGEWLSSNVFKDSDDTKASFYVPTFGVCKYYTNTSGVVTETNVDLVPSNTTSFEANYQTLISNIDTLISNVTSLNVNQIIAGDILKAFGSDQFYDQKSYPIGYPVEPIFDEAALTQIQNSITANGVSDALTETINFNAGTMTSAYTHTGNNSDLVELNPQNYVVNSYKDKMSAGEIISYTRLIPVITVNSSDGATIQSCGTEIIMELKYVTGYNKTSKSYTTVSTKAIGNAPSGEKAYIENCWSLLDWSPMLYIQDTGVSGMTSNCRILFDINNYALASRDNIDLYHQYATLSLMAVTSNIKRQNEFEYVR